ncbi:MAG: hypothetical protein ABIY90_15580 [Puia sp.]
MAIKLVFANTCIVVLICIFESCSHFCTSTAQIPLSGGIASINPDLDSVKVGDTLRFNSSFPKNLKYENGGAPDSGTINLSGAKDVLTDVHMTSILGLNTAAPAMDSFSLFPKKGTIRDNSLDLHAAKTIYFEEDYDSFNFSMNILPLKRGIYCLVVLGVFAAKKDCVKSSISIRFNNVDNHWHYLRDIYYGGTSINANDSLMSYCFKVY